MTARTMRKRRQAHPKWRKRVQEEEKKTTGKMSSSQYSRMGAPIVSIRGTVHFRSKDLLSTILKIFWTWMDWKAEQKIKGAFIALAYLRAWEKRRKEKKKKKRKKKEKKKEKKKKERKRIEGKRRASGPHEEIRFLFVNFPLTCCVISSFSSSGRVLNLSNFVPIKNGMAVLLKPLACLYLREKKRKEAESMKENERGGGRRASPDHSLTLLSVAFLERSNMKRMATASLQTNGSMFTNSFCPPRSQMLKVISVLRMEIV